MSSPRPSRRERQAQETRQDILDAALRLFAAKGYGATAVADIAQAAGVAVATVYTSVGTKPRLLEDLLSRVNQLAMVDEICAQMAEETDPAVVIRLEAHLTRLVAERAGDVIHVLEAAASASEEVAAAYAEGLSRHRAGARHTANRLAELNAFASDVDIDDAVAVIAVLTSHSSYQLLHSEYGWSYDKCEQCVAEMLISRLLPAGSQ